MAKRHCLSEYRKVLVMRRGERKAIEETALDNFIFQTTSFSLFNQLDCPTLNSYICNLIQYTNKQIPKVILIS